MKFAVGLTLAALAIPPLAAAGPGRMDVSKRSESVSTDDKAVLPENKPLERNEVLMDKRFDTQTVERKDAIIGERRSAITVEEGREKKLFVTPDRKEYDVIERKESVWNGKQSRFSTSEDAYRSKVATRFQEKIGEASPVTREVKPAISQRTTFDKVNRFVFRKNGDQRIRVNAAGAEGAAGDAAEASSPGAALPTSFATPVAEP